MWRINFAGDVELARLRFQRPGAVNPGLRAGRGFGFGAKLTNSDSIIINLFDYVIGL